VDCVVDLGGVVLVVWQGNCQKIQRMRTCEVWTLGCSGVYILAVPRPLQQRGKFDTETLRTGGKAMQLRSLMPDVAEP
jgi:hypothetical protein